MMDCNFSNSLIYSNCNQKCIAILFHIYIQIYRILTIIRYEYLYLIKLYTIAENIRFHIKFTIYLFYYFFLWYFRMKKCLKTLRVKDVRKKSNCLKKSVNNPINVNSSHYKVKYGGKFGRTK